MPRRYQKVQELLPEIKQYGITPSISRRGNSYDNAMAEKFFSIIKQSVFADIGQSLSLRSMR